jgi:hypothetical protein
VSALADDEEHGQEAGEEPDLTASEEPDLTVGEEPDLMASLEEMMESIRQAKVGELILSTVSTLASVAYGKLEVGDLPETKIAIDAVSVLLPLLDGQVDGAILRDFEQALTNLKLAYADAVSPAE